jgi:hypothetical protein
MPCLAGTYSGELGGVFLLTYETLWSASAGEGCCCGSDMILAGSLFVLGTMLVRRSPSRV